MDVFARAAIAGHKLFHPREYAPWSVWGNLSFPHRPTAGEVNAYREFAKPALGADSHILILGSTPELRDLVAELGAQPVVFDISLEMMRGMLMFARRAVPAREVWIKGNWLDELLPAKHFDAVFGDLSLRHVAPESQERFLERIMRALAPRGRCVLRVHATDPHYREAPYEDIFEEMRAFPFEKKRYEAMGVLLSRLIDRSTDDQRAHPEKIAEGLRRYLALQGLPFSYRFFLYEFFEKRLRGFPRISSQTRDEIESLFKKYFIIQDVRAAGHYPESEFYPLYSLKRRS